MIVFLGEKTWASVDQAVACGEAVAVYDVAGKYVDAPASPCLSNTTQLKNYIMAFSVAGEKVTLLESEEHKAAHPEISADVHKAIADAIDINVIKMHTIQNRSPMILDAGMRNYHRLGHTPCVSALGKPLAGVPTFIVSAGPSLDKNAHLLKEASKRGAVLVVNSAGPAVAKTGCVADCLVSIESLDVSESIAASRAKTYALALTSHERNMSVPGPITLFLPGSDPFSGLGKDLGEAPLLYGSSVSNAAFALAHRWGATTIVLVGQDCAYSDGQAYAQGTGKESAATVSDGYVDMEHADAVVRSFDAAGVGRPASHRPCVSIPGWGGGVVTSDPIFGSILHWFEAAAQAVPDHVLINATEGGAHIEGFMELTLAGVLEDMTPQSVDLAQAISSAPRVDRDSFDGARCAIVAGARDVLDAVRRRERAIHKGSHGADGDFHDLLQSAPGVQARALPGLIGLHRTTVDMTRKDRALAALRIVQQAAETVLRCLTGPCPKPPQGG